MYIVLSVAFMAIVTYLIRFIPFSIFTRQIKSKFVQSFLYYIPFSVLSAMTFPAVFYSTGSLLAGVIATSTALFLAYMKKSLVVIAFTSVVVAYVIMLL